MSHVTRVFMQNCAMCKPSYERCHHNAEEIESFLAMIRKSSGREYDQRPKTSAMLGFLTLGLVKYSAPPPSGQKNANFNLIHANLMSQIPTLDIRQVHELC